MSEASTNVSIIRDSAEQTASGSLVFKARYQGDIIKVVVSAAAFDSLHIAAQTGHEIPELPDRFFHIIERSIAAKINSKNGNRRNIDIEVKDLR